VYFLFICNLLIDIYQFFTMIGSNNKAGYSDTPMFNVWISVYFC